MAEWSRDNPWRQGNVFPADLAKKLNLAPSEGSELRIVVVISHDCDIAQLSNIEREVEVIPGRVVDKLDGRCTQAKNPRKLHLPLTTPSGEVFVELLANEKTAVPKQDLAGTAPDLDFTLTPPRHSVLQRWLGLRYRRAAFAGSFDYTFNKQTKLDRRLAAILKPLEEHIVAVFLDVDEGNVIERHTPEDTYTLDIYLVYGTDDDPDESEAAANKAKKEIEAICKEKLLDENKHWRGIELRECYVISDEAFTYRQSNMLKHWNLDYLSVGEEE